MTKSQLLSGLASRKNIEESWLFFEPQSFQKLQRAMGSLALARGDFLALQVQTIRWDISTDTRKKNSTCEPKLRLREVPKMAKVHAHRPLFLQTNIHKRCEHRDL